MRSVYRIAKMVIVTTSSRFSPIQTKDGRYLSSGGEELARLAGHYFCGVFIVILALTPLE